MNDSIVARLLDLSPLGMIVINPAGSVIFATSSAARLLGQHNHIPPGSNLYALLPAMAQQSIMRFIENAEGDVQTHSTEVIEYSVPGTDGALLNVALTHQSLDWAGKPHTLIFLANVTAQTQAELAQQEAEQRFYSLLQDVNDYGVFILGVDGRVISWSKSAESIKGYRSEDVVGKHISSFYVEEDMLSGKAESALHQALQDGRFEEDSIRVKKDGSTFWANVLITPIYDEHGSLSGYIKITRDISAAKLDQVTPPEVISNFHGAFQDAPIGMMLVDLEWKINRVNRSLCEMLGYTETELLTKTFQEITHPEDISTDLDLVRQMIAGDINDYRLEKRYFHKDGHVIWMLLSASLLKDQNRIPLHFIFHIQDISEYKRIQKQISEYAYQDPLTSLPNRRLLQDRLNLALTHARRYKRHMGIMFLDIDHFKVINDTHGHAFGDELIRAVASKLSECVRSADTVCRLGGDEFVIVISEIANQHDISVVAEKILKSTSEPITIEGIEAHVTMSVGAVIYDAETDDNADTLMKKADQALYEMKRAGRNGFRIFAD